MVQYSLKASINTRSTQFPLKQKVYMGNGTQISTKSFNKLNHPQLYSSPKLYFIQLLELKGLSHFKISDCFNLFQVQLLLIRFFCLYKVMRSSSFTRKLMSSLFVV